MNILIKVSVLCLILLSVVILTAPTSRAEFKVWAPINPNFTGGNPLNGPWMLSKAQLTNEEDPKFDESNPGKSANPGNSVNMSRLNEQMDRMMDRIAGSVDRSLSGPLNLQLTGGTGNTSIFAPRPAGE